jgi:hypothetical protein
MASRLEMTNGLLIQHAQGPSAQAIGTFSVRIKEAVPSVEELERGLSDLPQ